MLFVSDAPYLLVGVFIGSGMSLQDEHPSHTQGVTVLCGV